MWTSGAKLVRMGAGLLVAASIILRAESYVVGSSSNEGIQSRFADVQGELIMTVCRTPSSKMRECCMALFPTAVRLSYAHIVLACV